VRRGPARLARMAKRLTVALLFGGRSGEHEVSLRSAASVAQALLETHDVRPVLIDKSGRWLLQADVEPRPSGGTPVSLAPMPDEKGRLRRLPDGAEIARPDVFFPMLHGTFGEDGTIQGLFELAGVPYVGAGVAASAAAMDKEIMKALFAHAGLPQGAWRVLRGRDAAAEGDLLRELGLPLFVKPANLGSSVAVTKVKAEGDLDRALDAAFAYDAKVILEKAIDARELEVSVMGNDRPEASLPGEIIPDREFYDYDSKYSAESRTELVLPARLPEATTAEIRELAVAAFRAVTARGYARVDFFLERTTERLLVNEINTIPGFTSISMFPKLWELSGVAYPDLLQRLVDLALEHHEARRRLRTDYGGSAR
jgi:D-alanine-D-alanine ligase